MDLQLATLHDISDELLRRHASFALIAKEPTNQARRSLWVSGHGMRRGDIMRVARYCRCLFSKLDDRRNSRQDTEPDL